MDIIESKMTNIIIIIRLGLRNLDRMKIGAINASKTGNLDEKSQRLFQIFINKLLKAVQ